ncbi:MAG: twin transmembrane helix small protein [bacterium]|nr:twin transmembrane helix small protein [Betaproteobacteria bacterium]
MKILIVGFLVLIIASLGSALFYLFNDKGNSTRTVRALTLRVGLSVVLFLLLMLAHFTGVITLRGSAL